LVNRFKTKPPQADPVVALSDRELEVLLLICKGLSNQEIAEKLFISKRTVDHHRASLLTKTNTRNAASLVIYAIKHKMIEV
jgi:DNA-binding NarL/FixJ family response regulator